MFGFKGGRKNKKCRKHRFGKHGQGLGHGHHRHAHCLNLNEAEVGRTYRVLTNPDKKTMEMGIYHSGLITVYKNEIDNPNIVVGVGESRYIIPRELANRIVIK